MALWLTLVIALTCFGGLASPGPVPPHSTALKELIEELVNITQNQKVSACWPDASSEGLGMGDTQEGDWSWSGPRRLGLVLRCLWVRKKPQGLGDELGLEGEEPGRGGGGVAIRTDP